MESCAVKAEFAGFSAFLETFRDVRGMETAARRS